MSHHQDVIGAGLGFVSVGVANVLGIVFIGSLIQALLLGGAGAAGGWIVTKGLNYAIKKFKKSKTNL